MAGERQWNGMVCVNPPEEDFTTLQDLYTDPTEGITEILF
jgi:hypothetical protein